MKRSTFHFWMSEVALYVSVIGFAWRLYGDIWLGVWAAAAVGNILQRLQRN